MKLHQRPAPAPLIYRVGIRQRLLFTSEVLKHFQAHAQTTILRPESGGQLFGRISQGSVDICAITGPYKLDLLSRYLFVPNRKKQQKDIEEKFRVGLHYVGDWHTHPQAVPEPSGTDMSSMSDCFVKSRHELESFIMAVVGTDPAPRGLWVSLHNDSGYLRLVADAAGPGSGKPLGGA